METSIIKEGVDSLKIFTQKNIERAKMYHNKVCGTLCQHNFEDDTKVVFKSLNFT